MARHRLLVSHPLVVNRTEVALRVQTSGNRIKNLIQKSRLPPGRLGVHREREHRAPFPVGRPGVLVHLENGLRPIAEGFQTAVIGAGPHRQFACCGKSVQGNGSYHNMCVRIRTYAQNRRADLDKKTNFMFLLAVPIWAACDGLLAGFLPRGSCTGYRALPWIKKFKSFPLWTVLPGPYSVSLA